LPHQRVLPVQITARFSHRIEADLQWGHKLQRLLHLRAYFHAQSLIFTTLGGAYATLSIYRPELVTLSNSFSQKRNASKAKYFAREQLKIAQELGDQILLIKSNVHLAYYLIYKRRFTKAALFLKEQENQIVSIQNEELSKIIDAAKLRLVVEKNEWKKGNSLIKNNGRNVQV